MRVHDFFETKKMSAKDDPCWSGYHMVGTKTKDGREVPNCVPGKKGVEESAEFGSNYAEQLAQQTFDITPDLKDENEVLNLGYGIAKRELGSRAHGIFRDEDFPSDFVSAYGWLQDQKQGVAEGKADVNFSPEDIKRLEQINDLETLKTQAFGLISKPSAKPMKPEKVAWFKQALASKSNKIAVIKMMYDLMLSGEGNSVIGSKNSMNPNSYRKVFNSATTESAESLSMGDDVIITGDVEFNGKTGTIDSFGKDKRFVVVNLYNHGRHSFHSSDVSINDYADSDEEQARMSEAYQNDESNLWYIYDKSDGRLKQKMIDNLDEPRARSMGYRDSIDGALRVANIIRSKFDSKKYVQKQGNQWVPVYPFGQTKATEAFASPLPIKDMLASMYHPKVGDNIRTRKGGQIPGTVEKVADVNGIEYCWFRHPEGKLYKTPCSNVMRG